MSKFKRIFNQILFILIFRLTKKNLEIGLNQTLKFRNKSPPKFLLFFKNLVLNGTQKEIIFYILAKSGSNFSAQSHYENSIETFFFLRV